MIMASMRNWLNGNELDADGQSGENKNSNLLEKVIDHWKDKKNPRVVVVHCKAGKGRSGSMACSYLISQCGWTPEQAMARFTERRMRPKFGAGVSIPSQVRWIGYVDRWTKGGKKYVDREIEIVEVHAWGLRSGVKLCIEGFVEEGKKIKVFHTFNRDERVIVEPGAPGSTGMMDTLYNMAGYGISPATEKEVLDEARKTDQENGTNFTQQGVAPEDAKPATKSHTSKLISRDSMLPSRSKSKKDKTKNGTSDTPSSSSSSVNKTGTDPEPGGRAVIFKPHEPVRLPTGDVNISMERRNRAPSSMGLTMVTAVAHVWFNSFFEGDGPERDGKPLDNGVFEIDWDKMDGIKGSGQKGTRAADRIAVVWRSVVPEGSAEGQPPGEAVAGEEIPVPGADSPVPQMQPADWRGDNDEDPERPKKLGLRVQSADSADISRASSINEQVAAGAAKDAGEETDSLEGVKSDVGDGQPAKEAQELKAESDEKKLEAYAEKLPDPEGGSDPKGKGKEINPGDGLK